MTYTVLYLGQQPEEIQLPYPVKHVRDATAIDWNIKTTDLVLVDGNEHLRIEDIEYINKQTFINRKPIMLYKKSGRLNPDLQQLDHAGVLHASDDQEEIMVLISRIIRLSDMYFRYASDSELLDLFMLHSKSYVFFKDENARVLKLSDNYMDLLGIPAKDAIGKTMFDIFPEELARPMMEDDLRVVNTHEVIDVIETLNGRYYKTLKFPVHREGKKPLLAGFTMDITDLKEAEAQLKASKELIEELTVTDELLGINNRRGFLKNMEREMKRVSRTGNPSTLMLMDFDRFKNINDELGHFKADDFMRDFVKKVQSHLRSIDVFGRIGGDEFAIICVGTPLEEGVQVIERIQREVNEEPVLVEGKPYFYSISTGLTEMDIDSEDINDLLQRADVALYEAKAQGRNCYRIMTDKRGVNP